MLKYGQKFLQSLNKGYVGQTFNPSPLSLFQKDQRGKLANFVSEKVAKNPGDHLKSYFEGRNLVGAGGDLAWGSATNQSVGLARKVGMGAAAGIAGASLLGIDPFGVTSAARAGASAAMHGTIGMGMYRMGGASKIAGLGYLGLTAANTFRRGDNLGPM